MTEHRLTSNISVCGCMVNDLDLRVTVALRIVYNDDVIAIHCGMTVCDVTQLSRPISGVSATSLANYKHCLIGRAGLTIRGPKPT